MAGYGDDAGFEAWLTENGYTLPDGAPEPAVLRQRGAGYIDGEYGALFTGVPTGGFAQERAWPRTGATYYGSAIPDDVVPDQVIKSSYVAALHEADNPGSLAVATTQAAAVKREKVDVLEVEYFAGSGDAVKDATVVLSPVEGLLAPFLIVETMGGLGLWAIG
ncbi:DnaT-like ssDNA-binding protein [Brevundimonas sp. Root1279]|uniref:DnaT-like ssDNA-binding protein n=1 Tax=Brevundimonas sp. Root1279 TaxID=1736443 RepID=UPI0007014C64|nr:DnaT-like ssDNA-binding protein [Brevundimonas sp. Root1279]KQW79721.1 hypothetical protein ASC65_14325 [Brevundimonas sp. Root1279]